MIVKIPVYFVIEAEKGTIDTDLVRDSLHNHLEDVLSESSHTLEIEYMNSKKKSVVSASYATISEIHEILRTKS